jgi:DNA-binding MarR family transcriptional regulator
MYQSILTNFRPSGLAMETNYNIIRQLIDLWEQYEEHVPGAHTLLDFSEWITARIKEQSISNIKTPPAREFRYPSDTASRLNYPDDRSRFQEHILRIARFEEFYIRKYLADLPINTRLEYLFLHTVDHLEKVRKTDLINLHLVEYTTGMDTISRLVKNGLLAEMPDQNDKRAKLLILSKEGGEILQKANKSIDEMRIMFLACISPNKWKKALSVLHEIDDFHTKIYMQHYDKPYAEISNLIDSLKHLQQ